MYPIMLQERGDYIKIYLNVFQVVVDNIKIHPIVLQEGMVNVKLS